MSKKKRTTSSGKSRSVADESRIPDRGSSVSRDSHGALVALADALRRRKLILVVGAGASVNAGLPSWTDLVAPLRVDLGLPEQAHGTDQRLTDPLYVAEMYEQQFGRPALRTKVVEQFKQSVKPSPLHHLLVGLHVPLMFTTNYDRLLEKALEKAGKDFVVIARDSDYSFQPPEGTPILTKLHGDIMSPSEMVLTKSDVLDYHRTHPNLLQGFKDKLKTHTALLVGISLSDPNLEWLVEQALRELRGQEIRQYILVKDWHESLMQYYRLHSVEPIPLQSWDQAEDFLKSIERLARKWQPPFVQPPTLPGGVPDLQGQKALEEISDAALRGFRKEYEFLLKGFREGRRESLRDPTTKLWETLQKRPESLYGGVRVQTLLLLAREFFQLTHTPSSEELVEGERYLRMAEELADDSDCEDVALARATLECVKDNWQEALRSLDGFSSDAVQKTRAAIYIDSSRIQELEQLVPFALEKAPSDPDWATTLARYHADKREFQEATDVLSTWLQEPVKNVGVLETAGYTLAHQALHKHNEFCKRHSILENLSIILFHEQLVDCHSARLASNHYEQAANLCRQMEERASSSTLYEMAYKLRQMCKAPDEELRELAEKAWDDLPDEPKSRLKDISDTEKLGRLTIDLFRELLKASDFIPVTLMQLREWARRKGAFEEAARLLEEPQVRDGCNTVDEQTALAALTAELWQNSGEAEKALAAIDRFNPPVEYAYYPLVLKVAHFIFAEQDSEAETIISRLKELYPNNPVVLAVACQWHELKRQWQAMREAAERLLNLIATSQTYTFCLTALGNLKEWIKVLETLDRAQSEGIELDPVWTHINKARALIALQRDEDAIKSLEGGKGLESRPASEEKEEFRLGSEDLLLLTEIYVRTGRRDKALLEAQALVQRYPEFPTGHKAFVQLLRQAERWEEAFKAAQQAAILFPNDDAIQGMYVDTALMSGHGDAVADLLNTFQDRFPDSTIFRRVPLEDGFALYRDALNRAHQAERLYQVGLFTGVQAAYMLGSYPSYFRFWQASTRMKTGVYLASGEQGDDWTVLGSPGRPTAAVFDFPALITAFELDRKLGVWLNLLRNTFDRVYLPESFRSLLVMENSSLRGHVQKGRYRSLKGLRRLIELDERFAGCIPESEGRQGVSDEAIERSFAKERGILYFNEYGAEKERISAEFGFQELAVFLSAMGRLTRAQRKKLELLARGKDFRPLPLEKETLREIVADTTTLEALHESGLLDVILPYFNKVYISDRARMRLVQEIGSIEFTEEIADKFQSFENFLHSLSDWIEWVPVTEEDRREFGLMEKQDIGRQLEAVMLYLGELFALAAKKECVLVTDDRVTKMLSFSRRRPKLEEWEIPRVGSDSLLRYLRFREKSPIASSAYVDHYRQLMDWSYLHLPMDPDVVAGTWPTGSAGESIGPDSPIYYFRQSMTTYIEATQDNPALRGRVFAAATIDYNRQLARIMLQAHRSKRSPKEAGALVKVLALPFAAEKLQGRMPEALVQLLNQVLSVEREIPSEDEAHTVSEFLQWLDVGLQSAAITPEDIDLAWQAYLQNLVEVGVPSEWQHLKKEAQAQMVAKLLFALPERSRSSFLASHFGRQLTEEFGWKTTGGMAYSWKIPKADGLQEVTILEEEIETAIYDRLAQLLRGSELEKTERLKLYQERKPPGSFAIVIRILPSEEEIEKGSWKPVVKAINVIDYFHHPDRAIRSEAWKQGLVKLDSLRKNVKEWKEVKSSLEDENESIWRPAADRCVDILLSDQDVAVSILLDSFPLGPTPTLQVLRRLRLRHVQSWALFSELGWTGVADLLIWAKSVCQDASLRGLEEWKTTRKTVFHSIFPEVKVFRESLVRAIYSNGQEFKDVNKHIQDLLGEALINPSPAYKINVILVVLDLIGHFSRGNQAASPDDFWHMPVPANRDRPVHMTITALLLRALADDSLVFASDIDKESELGALSGPMAQALSALWQEEDDQNPPESRRYLACVVGGYLAASLVANEPNRSEHQWRMFREALFEMVTPYEWTRPDRKPGFYRPALAGVLCYLASFAVKALTPSAEMVGPYVMSQELRGYLLHRARRHRVFYAMLWGTGTADLSWLDVAMDTSADAGIAEFLKRTAGSSLKYWTSDELKELETLAEPFDADSELENYYEEFIEGSSTKDPELLSSLLLGGVRFAYVSQRPSWSKWMERCTTDSFIRNLEKYPETYRIWLFSFSQMLLVGDVSQPIKSRILSWLLRSVGEISSQDILLAHVDSVLLLMADRWYSDAVDTWLLSLVKAEGIEFPVRRRGLERLLKGFDNLAVEIRARLGSVFQEIAELPEWKGITELWRFAGRTHGYKRQ